MMRARPVPQIALVDVSVEVKTPLLMVNTHICGTDRLSPQCQLPHPPPAPRASLQCLPRGATPCCLEASEGGEGGLTTPVLPRALRGDATRQLITLPSHHALNY